MELSYLRPWKSGYKGAASPWGTEPERWSDRFQKLLPGEGVWTATPAEPPSWVESQGLRRNRQLEAEARGQRARRRWLQELWNSGSPWTLWSWVWADVHGQEEAARKICRNNLPVLGQVCLRPSEGQTWESRGLGGTLVGMGSGGQGVTSPGGQSFSDQSPPDTLL